MIFFLHVRSSREPFSSHRTLVKHFSSTCLVSLFSFYQLFSANRNMLIFFLKTYLRFLHINDVEIKFMYQIRIRSSRISSCFYIRIPKVQNVAFYVTISRPHFYFCLNFASLLEPRGKFSTWTFYWTGNYSLYWLLQNCLSLTRFRRLIVKLTVQATLTHLFSSKLDQTMRRNFEKKQLKFLLNKSIPIISVSNSARHLIRAAVAIASIWI